MSYLRCSGIILAAFLAAPVFGDEIATAQRFSAAKRSEPELIAFMRGLPKGADLHNHESGAIYAETYLDAAAQGGFYVDPDTLACSTQSAPGLVSARDLLGNRALAGRFLEAASMRGQGGHDHFFNSFHIFAPIFDSMAPGAALAEIAGRARDQNVMYLELMADVNSDWAAAAALRDPPAIDDMGKALAAMQKRFPAFLADTKAYLDERDRQAAKLLGIKAPITSTASPIMVRYIFQAPRNRPDPEFFAAMALGMAVAQKEPRVAGITILGPEDAAAARRNFDSQMRIIDFLWNRLGRPNLTLHAGELTLEYAPMEVMRSRIRKSVELGHARRIGHGVSVAWEDDLPGLLREMRAKRVAVEVNLTSNEGILKVSGDKHPWRLYRAAGVPLTLNTDDEGVNRSNLTMEYAKAARTFDLSYRDVKDLSRNGLEYSFLQGESLYVDGDYYRLRPELADLRNAQWEPDAKAQGLMAASEKLALEVRLERAFLEFEK